MYSLSINCRKFGFQEIRWNYACLEIKIMAKLPWYYRNVEFYFKDGKAWVSFLLPWYAKLILLTKVLWNASFRSIF